MQLVVRTHEGLPAQSTSQRLSAVQRTGPVLQAMALHSMSHRSPASHETVLAQELVPVQSSSQEPDAQLSGPRQEPLPLQATRQGPADSQLTAPWQESVMRQSTKQPS